MLEESEDDTKTNVEVEEIVRTSQANAKKGMDSYLQDKGLNTLVMINNAEALLSAVAGYPELAVPAGYDANGEPVGIRVYWKAI